MKKLVVLKFDGTLKSGFRVNLTISNDGETPKSIKSAKLPSARTLIQHSQSWRNLYCNFNGQSRIQPLGAKNVNIEALNQDFNHKSQELINSFNNWLASDSFIPVKNCLQKLNIEDEIRVIIATSCQELRKLPWHLWDVLQKYDHAEVALSAPDAERGERIYREKARILIILGDSTGINVEADREQLEQYCSNGEIILLKEPSRGKLIDHLRDNIGWDMLFFSGHSQTEGTQGRIFLNKNESLTMGELREALQVAINKRLQIAFFNSCSGLGLASELEQLNIPQVIVMQEPVPDKVAQEFLKYFLEAFTGGKSLYISIKSARQQLHQNLDGQFPCASWLPVIVQNQLETPPTWQSLGIISLCPYRGLEIFREEHAEFFFGREAFVQQLVTDVTRKPLVAIIGASGSGKSSVVFAGLIPQLRQQQWQIISFRPGNKPYESLAMALEEGKREKGKAKGVNILFVIDQFEEIFTLCPDAHERKMFIDGLLQAIEIPGLTLVITLRADFLGKAMSYHLLGEALQNYRPSLLAPMNRQELENAITKPAAKYCVEFESGLVNKLIDDVGDGEGSLPLQQFTLTQLWQKQSPGKLTHQAYREIGGVREAIANHAEYVYRRLSKQQRSVAPSVFIQLVQPGEGTEDTRRVATKQEVGEKNWNLVQHLANERLLVTNCSEGKKQEETVEIVHEALIREWGTLHNWVQDNREFRTWQERLKPEVREWHYNNYDSGRLLQETPLSVALSWYNKRASELTEEQQKFIQASVYKQNKKERERKTRRRLTIFALAFGLVIVSILAGLSEIRRTDAEVAKLSITAEKYFGRNDQEAALVQALKAGKQLKSVWQPWVTAGTQMLAVSTLQEVVYNFQVKTLKGHTDVVFGVSYSPDGKTLASTSSDKTIKLWNTETGKAIQTIKGHTSSIINVSYSPNAKIIASASTDKTVKLWDIRNIKAVKTIVTLKGHTGAVFGVSFSPDGKTLASTSTDKTVKLWDIQTGREIITLIGHNDAVFGACFSPDGKTIASASADQTIKLWDIETGKEIKTFKGHIGQVWGINFSPDGKTLASGSWDKIVKLWDVETGKEIKSFSGHNDAVFSVRFSPDGKTLASSSSSKDTAVKLWDINTGYEIKTLKGHTDSVIGISFSPDGKTLASASADRTIKLWNINTRFDIETLKAYTDKITSINFSQDKKIIAASSDNTIKLWNSTNTDIKIFTGHTDLVNGISFSLDGKTLASASWDKTVKLWDINTGKEIKTLEGHTDAVFGASFSPDGKTLASASEDKTIKLWDTATGQEIKTLKGHTSNIINVSFSPDGNTLASASSDNTVKIWDINAAKDIKTLKGHTSHVWNVSFSPDGKTLASTSRDRTLKLWNINTGKEIKTLKGHTNLVYGASFSPDGKTLASASADKTVKLWDTETGSEIKTLEAHQGAVIDVRFSTDGKTLTSVSNDNTLILWNLNLDDLLIRGCRLIEGYLQNDPDVNAEDRNLCIGKN
ncbi:WD-repeat protein [Calothrix sp. NIES-4071]|nr:WD-repeat protein [Calothrix sp. NIES-4071]BAZ64189.1 WD-repeat protein [Calothrix sp. NIES-4105]